MLLYIWLAGESSPGGQSDQGHHWLNSSTLFKYWAFCSILALVVIIFLVIITYFSSAVVILVFIIFIVIIFVVVGPIIIVVLLFIIFLKVGLGVGLLHIILVDRLVILRQPISSLLFLPSLVDLDWISEAFRLLP